MNSVEPCAISPDFPAKRAAKELLKYKFIAVDDITEGLVEAAREELCEALPWRHDDIAIDTLCLDTDFVPVFIFYDDEYDVLNLAIAFVKEHYPGVRVREPRS